MKFFTLKIAILIVTIINIWTSSNLNWGGNNYKSIIASDACGYYAYLPAVFIYKDLQFSHFDKVEMSPSYYSPHLTQDYRNNTGHGIVNQYFVGCALLWTPFFGIANYIAPHIGYSADGYSYPYQIAINCASIFYLSLSLWLLGSLLRKMGFSENSVFWAIIFTVYATNLFYYTVISSSFSHVYSFSIITLFLCLVYEYIQSKTALKIIMMGILLGLIILIRPVNAVIVLFIPFFFNTVRDFINQLREIRILHYILAGISLSCVVFIQLLIYKIQTGSWLIYSYKTQTFDFLHPEFFNFLFSFRKGFFIYTPVFLFFLMTGVYSLWINSKFKATVFLITFMIFCYVCSSWWCWWYGYTYSQRPMVDVMCLLTILICFTLNQFAKSKKIIISVAFIFLLLNQFQIYQARYHQILPDGMTMEHYFDVFLDVEGLIEATK